MSPSRPTSPAHTSPLRALRKVSTHFDALNLVTDPAFTKSASNPAPAVAPQLSNVQEIAPVRPRTDQLRFAEIPSRQTGYLNGVSLSAILQMLHLERKTCVVEVSAHGRLGAFTLVNGELVDASTGECDGEDAACAMLTWHDPVTAILDGAEIFRHTVQRPITQLIIEAMRIVDETGGLNPAKVPPFDREAESVFTGTWQWLIDSLTLIGAANVQIVTPESHPGDRRQTGLLTDPNADIARGIRTWASLLGSDVTEVVATRSDHIVILAVLNAERSEFIYAEAPGAEAAELIRRSLRSIQRSA